MDEDLAVFVHVCKLLLPSCVGARLTFTGCLKLILGNIPGCFLN